MARVEGVPVSNCDATRSQAVFAEGKNKGKIAPTCGKDIYCDFYTGDMNHKGLGSHLLELEIHNDKYPPVLICHENCSHKTSSE